MQNPFRAKLVHAYELPQQTIYVALHNDYSEHFEPTTDLPEDRCGDIAIKRLLDGKRGHFGPLEHAHLTLLLQADHNTIMQLRTHRVGLSFDVQSLRYTGFRIERVALQEVPVTEVFYFREPGCYSDRNGQSYEYTPEMRSEDEAHALDASILYQERRQQGVAEEHARNVLTTSYFQNAVITGNVRSWFHLMDMRLKADAQLEVRWAMEQVSHVLKSWVPELFSWYVANRKGRALLAP